MLMVDPMLMACRHTAWRVATHDSLTHEHTTDTPEAPMEDLDAGM